MKPPRRRIRVAVNFAQTWDHRVSTRNQTPSDFSSPRDKQRLLEIRATGDAVLVGRKTLEADRMVMGLPDESLRAGRLRRKQAPYPFRVLVSDSGEFNPALRVFQEDFSPIIIFTTHRMPQATRDALAGKVELHIAEADHVDLPGMIQTLEKDYSVKRLICEGGPTLFRSLLEEDLVDEINLTFCPRIFGGEAAPTITGPAGEFLSQARECRLERMEVIGDECFARYRVMR